MSSGSEGSVIQALNRAELDPRTATSPYDKLHLLEEHVHAQSQVYPTLADGALLTCGNAAAWTLGDFVEIVPALTIGNIFDIHWISIEFISANGVYELVLYQSAADTEIGRIRFVKTNIFEAVTNIKCMTPIIPADARIRGKVASDTGNADTVRVSVKYHIYT